jgi:hypothetical protein
MSILTINLIDFELVSTVFLDTMMRYRIRLVHENHIYVYSCDVCFTNEYFILKDTTQVEIYPIDENDLVKHNFLAGGVFYANLSNYDIVKFLEYNKYTEIHVYF